MSPMFIDQNRFDINFLRLMVYVLFVPFFLLIDPNIPVQNYYLAGLALSYVVLLYVFPRISAVLNAAVPLTLIIDMLVISLLLFFNEKYIYSLSLLYILPIIRLSFNLSPLTAVFAASFSSLLYIIIGFIQQIFLLPIIIQCVLFFITSFFTWNLIKSYQQNYYQQVNQDTLTKINNRRYFNHMLSKLVQENCPFSLIILDLDNFKVLNDTHGHHHGDYVLKVIALIQKECTRSYDIVTRFGGDEFAIILPKSSKEMGKSIAERIRNNVLTSPKLLSYSNITISLGMASFPLDAANEEEIVQKADEALYKAKNSGKNCVCVYGSD